MHPEFIDIGANLTHQSFAADLPGIMASAQQAGVRRMVVTGADLEGSKQALELTRQYPSRLFSTAGVHPHHAQDFDSSQRDLFEALLSESSVVAVGECGLDYFRNFSPQQAQRNAFESQLQLAAKVRKPVFLHQRDAHGEFLAILKEHRAQLVGGVAHCFTGTVAELEDYLALGLYIGVTGWVCDERRGQALREAVPLIPNERLLIETDAPYLLPRDLKPAPKMRRNEPRFLPHIAMKVAELRGSDLDEVAAQSTRNAVSFFGLETSRDS
ncbi:MAG TPA: TatD family hydrolase [Steroidobacteraceae bacterium]